MEVDGAAARDRYDRALGRAGAFLRGMQRRDGSTAGAGSIWGYYSQPLALLSGGTDLPWGSGSALRRDNPEGGNAYWDIGYIIAFLTALSRATGSHEYLDAAGEMFDLFHGYAGFADHVWKTPWACAALHQATGGAVERIDEILSVPGIDAALLGLGDLSASLGCHLDFTAPRVVEAVETVLAACRRHRVLPGMAYAHDAATARGYVEQGFRLVGVGSDDAFLMDGSRRALDALGSLP